MRSRPLLRWYIAATALVAVAALVVGAALAPPIGFWDLVLAAILGVLAGLGRLWVVHLSTKLKLAVEDAATFAAALTLGPLLAMLIGAASVLVKRPRERRTFHSLLFNCSARVLQVGAGALTYRLLNPGAEVHASLVALLAAAVAQYGTGIVLVDIVVSIQLRRRPLASLWAIHQRDLPYSAVLYVLGALAAFAAQREPLAAGLLVVPMLVLVRVLRRATRLRDQTKQAVFDLADLIDRRDAYTHGHSQRVAIYAERLARHMKLPEAQVELITLAARVHDIGKIATPDEVLRKPGPLDHAELEVMRRHAQDGAALLAKVPEFWEGAALVAAHHERADGGGYPHGAAGQEIPIEAAVIAVADAFDAMTTDRPYRQALPWPEVRAELFRGRGTQWDARVVDAFFEMAGGSESVPTLVRVPA